MSRTKITRLGIGAVVLLASLVLAACNGAGALPSGQVHLYIANPSASGASYTAIYLTASSSGSPTSLPDIASGSTYDAHVTPDTYTLSFNYANSSTGSPAQTATLNVPSGGCTYTGPTASTTGSGC